MNKLNELEHSVLNAGLSGEHPILEELRRQASACRVRRREQTGAGFFTWLELEGTTPRVRGSGRIGGVSADLRGLEHGAGFTILVEDGALAMIEGFSYEEPWPEGIGQFQMFSREADADLGGLTLVEG